MSFWALRVIRLKKVMITITIFFIFLGSFSGYITSEKSELHNLILDKKSIQSRKNTFRLLAIAFLILALCLSMYCFGISVGLILWIFLTTLTLSFLVLLVPILQFSYKHVLGVLVLSILIEYFL